MRNMLVLRPVYLLVLALVIFLLAPARNRLLVSNSFSTVVHAQKTDAPKSDAQKAFELIKTLAGNWRGPVTTVPQMPEMSGLTVRVSLRVTSGGAAVMHEMVPEGRPTDPTKGDDDPITMLYIESDRLMLTHYCDSGKNRPRMVGKLSPDGKTVDFDFLDVGGGSKYGYMSHAVFTIIDADHHTEEWTYMAPGNKAGRARQDLTRVK